MSVRLPKTSVFYDSEGNRITLGSLIGQGGEGSVYEVVERPDLVAKFYFKDISSDKAQKLIGMSKTYNSEIGRFAAWPCRTLHKSPNSTPVGFLMNKIIGYKEIHDLYGTASRKREFEKADWSFMILTARNLASAISVIHQNDCVVGDLNDRNIIIGQDALVKLIDCDSYQIKFNGELYHCEVGVPEFTSPELQGKTLTNIVRTPNHDNFALAIFIFRLLFLSKHPFAGRYTGRGEQPSSLNTAIEKHYYFYGKNAALNYLEPPPGALTTEYLSPEIAGLFERAFNRESSMNNGRPTAKQWITALEGLKDNLKVCMNNPMHVYYKHSKSCPWCSIEASSSVVLFYVGRSTKTIPTGSGSTTNVTEFTVIWARITKISSPGSAPAVHFGPSNLPVTPTPLPLHVASEIAGQQFKNASQAILVGLLEGGVAIFIFSSGLWKLALTLWFFTIPLCIWAVSNIKNILSRQPDSQVYKDEKERRTRELSIIQDKMEYAKKRWHELAIEKRFQDKLSELNKVYTSLQALDQEYKSELQKLEANRRSYQLQKFLEKFSIDRAKLDGIGPGLKAQLASYGIDTAADITSSKVYNVPGFGPARVSTLTAWRNSIEAKFVFNPNQGIDPRDIQALKSKYDQQQYVLTNKLKAGENELLNIKSDIQAKRSSWQPQIKQISEELAQKYADARVFQNIQLQKKSQNQAGNPAPFIWGAIIIGLIFLFANLSKGDSTQSTAMDSAYNQSGYETTVETPPAPVTSYVTGHNVNLRLSPDTTSAVISTVPVGLEVTEIERQGDWVHISYLGGNGEITGWISSSFLDTSENTVNVIKSKVEEGRKKIDTIFLELVAAEKGLSAKVKKLISLEEELKEEKSLPPRPYKPRIDLSSNQTMQDYTAVQPEPDPVQEEFENLEGQVKSLEADLKKAGSLYKQKRVQYQKLKEFDDAYIDAYLKLSTTQDLQKLADKEQVTYAEDTTSCGSLGCSLTIKDPTGRTVFSGMSQTAPYFLYYTPGGGFRSFIIKQKDLYSYQPGDSSYGKLYVYDETQGQYILSNDDEAAYVSKMEVF